MEETEVVFVNEIDVMEGFQFPYIGQLILRDILVPKYCCKVVNNKILMDENIIPENSSMLDKVTIMAKYIADCRPKIVDFYTVCDTFPLTIFMAQLIRKWCPDATIVFGGPQASLLIEESLTLLSCVDIIAYTEGERVIEDLVAAILEHRNLDNIPGIAYLEHGEVRVNQSPKLIEAEELHRYFVKDFFPYRIEKYNEIRLEGGRGCPFNCSFCSTSLFWKRMARMKPINDLISEIKYYIGKYGVKRYGMVHDLFTSNKKYVLALCEKMQEEGLDIEWSCSVRLDTIDEEMIEKMANARCNAMYIGIETGSERMQKILHKNLDLNRIGLIAEACKKNRVAITFSFIMGFPDETIQDFRDTVKWIERLMLFNCVKNEIQLHMFSPYPATEETNKIKNILVFPDNRNYLPIIQRNCLFRETEEIIEKYPQLCSAYMDFSTEVRTKYRCFPNFIEMIMQAKATFIFSISYLILQYGLIAIYDNFSEQIERDLSELQKDMLDADRYNRTIIKVVENIVSMLFKDMKGVEKRIYRYEHIFGKIVLSQQKTFCIVKTEIDLKQAREQQKIVRKNKRYIFFGGNLKAEMLEIENDEYEKNVTQALKESGYLQMREF